MRQKNWFILALSTVQLWSIIIWLFLLCHRATDCNPKAAHCAKRTANQNKVCVEVVTSDLLNALQPRLNGTIDLLMFNPPYVVTPSEEVRVLSIINNLCCIHLYIPLCQGLILPQVCSPDWWKFMRTWKFCNKKVQWHCVEWGLNHTLDPLLLLKHLFHF